MSRLYHGDHPVDMTPSEAADEIARISRKMSVVERDREVRQACEVVRAGARRLTVLGWANSGNALIRALETIEAALAGDCEVRRG